MEENLISKLREFRKSRSGCAIKIFIFAFMFLANNNVGTETGFYDLEKLPRRLTKHKNFNNVHIQSQIIGLATFIDFRNFKN